MILSAAAWASASDGLIYSAMGVYLLAMLCYAAESAGVVSRGAVERRVPAPAGGAPDRTGPHAIKLDGRPVDARPPGQRIGRTGTALAVLGFALNVAGVVARGLAAERAPWGNMYEFAIVAAVAAGGAYLACLSRQPVRSFGVWIIGLILLTLGMATTVLYTEVDALVPVLNSYWLVVHVAAAITAGGVFTLGAVSTALFLVRARADRRNAAAGGVAPGGYAGTLPAAATLERVSHFAHMFAFPIWTFAVMAGAIWAENSWGRYWGWDPKETWAFITWVLYAAYLHAQATVGWRGTKASWFALAGYAAFLFNFFGVNIWLPGLHSYAGV